MVSRSTISFLADMMHLHITPHCKTKSQNAMVHNNARIVKLLLIHVTL